VWWIVAFLRSAIDASVRLRSLNHYSCSDSMATVKRDALAGRRRGPPRLSKADARPRAGRMDDAAQ
jgi:hypothetical protein